MAEQTARTFQAVDLTLSGLEPVIDAIAWSAWTDVPSIFGPAGVEDWGDGAAIIRRRFGASAGLALMAYALVKKRMDRAAEADTAAMETFMAMRPTSEIGVAAYWAAALRWPCHRMRGRRRGVAGAADGLTEKHWASRPMFEMGRPVRVGRGAFAYSVSGSASGVGGCGGTYGAVMPSRRVMFPMTCRPMRSSTSGFTMR